jgi:hypothetical protein
MGKKKKCIDFKELPQEAITLIFQYLDGFSLASSERVCKHWNTKLISENFLNELWWRLCIRIQWQDGSKLPSTMSRAERKKKWKGEFSKLYVDEAEKIMSNDKQKRESKAKYKEELAKAR